MAAEFEADLIRARTREGMAVAKVRGKLKGWEPKLSPTQVCTLWRSNCAGDHSIASRTIGVVPGGVWPRRACSQSIAREIATDRCRRVPLPSIGEDGVGLVREERRNLSRVDRRCGDLLELVRFRDLVVKEPGTPPGEDVTP